MSILINKNSKIITQGITGKTGQFHTEKCQEYANGKNCFVAGAVSYTHLTLPTNREV